MADTKRYWSGDAWTEHRVPSPPAPSTPVVPPMAPRIAAAALVVLAAIAIWFGMAPDKSYDEARQSIESVDDLNNEDTAGAPQQEVVNGWTTIDYLHLLSVQQEDSDNRRDALFVLALVGAAVGVASRKSGSKAA